MYTKNKPHSKDRYDEVLWQGFGNMDTTDGEIILSTWCVEHTKGTHCIFILTKKLFCVVLMDLFL